MEVGEEEGRDGDCWLWLMKNLDVLDLGTHPTILPYKYQWSNQI